MDRIEIKNEAKAIVREKFSEFWLRYFFVLTLSFAMSLLYRKIAVIFNHCYFSFQNECVLSNGSIINGGLSFFYSIITTFLTFGMYKIMLKLVRKKETEFNDLFAYKKDFFKLFALSFITELLVSLGYVLIVPGIILQLCYAMIGFIYVDNNGKKSVIETMKSSRELMNGYKMDYFIFNISFVGWLFLSAFTFGLALVYVIPYVYISQALYYENLKKQKNTLKPIDNSKKNKYY